jgi:hypothetical protein
MNKDELILQLIYLKKSYADCGETEEELFKHFDAELNSGEIVWLEQDGKVTAFADYSMISEESDIERAEAGKRTEGDILFILNCVCLEPGLIWRLKKLSPPHRGMAWRDKNRRIHCPKGFHHELV